MVVERAGRRRRRSRQTPSRAPRQCAPPARRNFKKRGDTLFSFSIIFVASLFFVSRALLAYSSRISFGFGGNKTVQRLHIQLFNLLLLRARCSRPSSGCLRAHRPILVERAISFGAQFRQTPTNGALIGRHIPSVWPPGRLATGECLCLLFTFSGSLQFVQIYYVTMDHGCGSLLSGASLDGASRSFRLS